MTSEPGHFASGPVFPERVAECIRPVGEIDITTGLEALRALYSIRIIGPSEMAARRPDPARILAQTISMACPGGPHHYAVLGLLIEGTGQTLDEHIPKEPQAEIAETLKQLLDERMKACGVPDCDG